MTVWRTGEFSLPDADVRIYRGTYLLKGNVNLGEKSIYLINDAAISVTHREENKAKSSPLT